MKKKSEVLLARTRNNLKKIINFFGSLGYRKKINRKKVSWAEEYLNIIKKRKSYLTDAGNINEPLNLQKKLNKSVIITGASVTGKTTLFRCLIAHFGLLPVPVHTTRVPRGDEINNIDGVYITENEFKDNFLKGKYIQESLESAFFSGAYYGCPVKWIDQVNGGQTNCFVSPTIKIAKKVKEKLGDKIIWIHMTANGDVRRERLVRRNPEMGKDDFDVRIKMGDIPVDITGHDLVIDSSYLSAWDIFFYAVTKL